MIWIARYWKPLAGLAAVLLWSVLMFQWGDKTRAVACEAARLGLENAQLEAHRNAVQRAREVEQRHAAQLAEIAERHEQDKRDAEADHDRLVADLRAGNQRLQNRWRGCEAAARVSGDATAAALADEAARDREESAARIVRAARDADDWIRRLQDVVRSRE